MPASIGHDSAMGGRGDGSGAGDAAAISAIERLGERTRDLTIRSPALEREAKVRLLLPSRFDAEPDRSWPVLFLLHGASEPASYRAWTTYTDVEALSAATELLVVMPEAGDHGYYSNWWNRGRGGPPRWETFHVRELPQLLERDWRAGPRRAIAGLSMGGFGALSYAARHRGMFRAAASFSGVLDIRSADWLDPAIWNDSGSGDDARAAHNPLDLAAELRGIRLFVAFGDGRPGPFDSPGREPDELEAKLAAMNEAFVARLAELGIPAAVDRYGAGTHAWPYWQRALHAALPVLLEALASS